jgi:hypothetical protein
MRRLNYLKPVLLLTVSSLLAGGCVVHERAEYREPGVVVDAGGEVVADSAPPAPIVETETVSPGPDFVWIGGGWVWGGGRWHWDHGRWARPPHRGAVWVRHGYVYRGGRHVYVRGGWR